MPLNVKTFFLFDWHAVNLDFEILVLMTLILVHIEILLAYLLKRVADWVSS